LRSPIAAQFATRFSPAPLGTCMQIGIYQFSLLHCEGGHGLLGTIAMLVKVGSPFLECCIVASAFRKTMGGRRLVNGRQTFYINPPCFYLLLTLALSIVLYLLRY
jgi:hypothetical protein